MKKFASLLLSAAIFLGTLVFATGCTKVQKIDLSKYVAFEGYSGMASIKETPEIQDYDTEYADLKEERSEARDDDDDKKYEELKEKMSQLKNLKRALDCVTFRVVKGDNGKLANGDTIKIKARYSEDKVARYDVAFEANEFQIKVKDLEEKEQIDPFDEKYVKITFTGLDGDGSVDVDKTDEADDLSIYYSADKSYDVSNGDTIKIEAYTYSDEIMLKDCDEDGKVTKEFTVEGLGEIPEKLENVDTSEIDKEFLAKIEEEEAEADKGETDKGYDFGIADDNFRYSEIKILSVGALKAEKKIYGCKKSSDSTDNIYAVIYSQPCKVKMIDPSYSSKVKKGAVKNVNAYFIAYTNNYTMVADDKLQFRSEYYYISTAKTFKSVKDAEKNIKDYYNSYEYTEVK